MFLALYLSITFISHLTAAAKIPIPRTFLPKSPQPNFACTNDINWRGDGYDKEDCMKTVQRLWNVMVNPYGDAQFEFLAPDAKNKTHLPVIQTPLRYTAGQCTLAIVMLDYFVPGSLPGENPEGTYLYGDSDVASFEDLWSLAGTVEVNCVISQKTPGWAPAGNNEAIGVFIWNTNSYWNRQVPWSPPGNNSTLSTNSSDPLLTTNPEYQEQMSDS